MSEATKRVNFQEPSDHPVSSGATLAINNIQVSDYNNMCWESISLDTVYMERTRSAQCNLRSSPQ